MPNNHVVYVRRSPSPAGFNCADDTKEGVAESWDQPGKRSFFSSRLLKNQTSARTRPLQKLLRCPNIFLRLLLDRETQFARVQQGSGR